MSGPIWLISGAPGVGKSTLAAALAWRYARAVHIPVDDLRDMVTSGRASPVAVAWTDETTLQFDLARRVAARMARDYAQKGSPRSSTTSCESQICTSSFRTWAVSDRARSY